MTRPPTVPSRVYAMTRLGDGDYLLPSNDARTLWRLYRYREDGSVTFDNGRKLVGTFWAAAYYPGTLRQAHEGIVRDLSDYGHATYERWITHDSLLPSRQAAIEAAMKAGARGVGPMLVPGAKGAKG